MDKTPAITKKNGVPVQTGEKTKFSDGTTVTMREESSWRTPDGWFNMDIGGNEDVERSLQGKKILKFKFPASTQ